MFALLALVAMSLATVTAVTRARSDMQREREAQLLWVGDQYRRALKSYGQAPRAAGQSQYPATLADLLEDKRGLKPVRHLRQVYPDPMTGKADWVLETENGLADGRILGLHSRSALAPIRHAGPGLSGAGFALARTYADWRFLATDAVDDANTAPLPASPNGLGGGSGSDSLAPDAPTPPAAPPAPQDPTTTARTQCLQQFGAPMLRCRGPDYPMGSDRFSCQRAEADALAQCLAPLGGYPAGN